MISKKDKEKARAFAVEAAKLAIDRHCSDVVVLDLRGKNPAAELFVIATGTSDRQTRSVADEIIQEAKPQGFSVFGKAGYEEGRWVLVDFVDVVVHLFDSDSRDYYDLELLWGDAETVDLGGYGQNAADK